MEEEKKNPLGSIRNDSITVYLVLTLIQSKNWLDSKRLLSKKKLTNGKKRDNKLIKMLIVLELFFFDIERDKRSFLKFFSNSVNVPNKNRLICLQDQSLNHFLSLDFFLFPEWMRSMSHRFDPSCRRSARHRKKMIFGLREKNRFKFLFSLA